MHLGSFQVQVLFLTQELGGMKHRSHTSKIVPCQRTHKEIFENTLICAVRVDNELKTEQSGKRLTLSSDSWVKTVPFLEKVATLPRVELD